MPLFLSPAGNKPTKLGNPEKSVNESVREKIKPKTTSCSCEPSSPVHLLRDIFARNGSVLSSSSSSNDQRFQRPSREVMEAYDMETCRAVRSGNLKEIKRLHSDGHSLNGSNQFGECLLFMACRRGDKAVVEFMLKEANVRTNVRDDMGRNVFHDAFWTPKPNLDVMDVLLETVSPELLLVPDIRGHTPFDYARRTHWDVWCKYLQGREKLLARRLAIINSMAQYE